MAGIGTGIGGIASSASYYNQLSADLILEQVATSIVTMQDQLNSLASVVLQNRRGLNLLLKKAGGGELCLFLNEDCCFYVNQPGIDRDIAQQLQDQVTHRRQELANSWNR
jgi:hypothetical protein